MGDAGDGPWAFCADGLVITVRLTPKAGRDSIDGIVHLSDGRSVLRARVSATPTDGEANGALMRLLAQTLRVAPRDIALVGGATSRIKRVMIKGDSHVIAATLEQIREVAAK